MERVRTNTPAPDGTVRWKKLGRGVFKLGPRIIRGGEIFFARPDQIPASFRDLIKPMDGDPDAVNVAEEDAILAVKPAYTKKKRETSNYWDIFDGEGKKVNEKALREEQADEMLKSFE